ncbi:MAG: hypothetical protein Fues2KO_29560 [Fuerstiella sp.]
MTDAPKSVSLMSRVRNRLRVTSVAHAFYRSSMVVLVMSILVLLSNRLLGLIPREQEQPLWLLSIPVLAGLAALVIHRRVEQQAAARAIDEHAKTRDLFLTLASLDTSAGEYQPLVASAAEQKAEQIDVQQVVPFRLSDRLLRLSIVVAVLAAVAIWLPQFDPTGRVEAATKQEEQKKEIKTILREAMKRKDQLDKEASRDEELDEALEAKIKELQSDFRKMEPRKQESNARVLKSHGTEMNEMWKAAANEQLRRMMHEPLSQQRLGGARNQKMNEWLKDLKEGKTDSLKQELKKAQETMQAMAEAKTPEERKALERELKKDLQTLQRFAKTKAGSRELNEALSKALKALAASKPKDGESSQQDEMSKEAMQALKESLELSEKEMEEVARSAKELKKLEEALKTIQQAEKLNNQEALDGSKCEGCETLEDYAALYEQLMGQGAGDGDKDRNEGDGGGAGRGGETPEDDSDPEGYKREVEKPQVKPGKILLSIKTKEYADRDEIDPDELQQIRQQIDSLKSSVQSAIETEEVPPGYVDGIKGYFDKLESVDPKLQDQP